MGTGVALPRGEEIVTRCPLQLALRPGPEGAIIEYKKADGQKRVDELELDEVADAVSSATDYLSGANQGISHDVISLQVTRPNAPILTLVDLPGITRMAVGELLELLVHDQLSKLLQGSWRRWLSRVSPSADLLTGTAGIGTVLLLQLHEGLAGWSLSALSCALQRIAPSSCKFAAILTFLLPAGDQPENIEEQVKSLINKYMGVKSVTSTHTRANHQNEGQLLEPAWHV